MASNIRQQSTSGVGSRQINNSVNAHASGDICYEQGYYGVAADDVKVGGTFRMLLDCYVYAPVPAATAVGTRVGCASKPSGAITVTATSPAVVLGIVAGPLDANNYALVELNHALSMGL